MEDTPSHRNSSSSIVSVSDILTISSQQTWYTILALYCLLLIVQASSALLDNPSKDPEMTPTPTNHNGELQYSALKTLQTKFKDLAKVIGSFVILRGDFIRKAIIKLAGRLLTLVTFSFG